MKVTLQGPQSEVALLDVLLLQSHAGYDVRMVGVAEGPPTADGTVDSGRARWRGEAALFRGGEYARPIARAREARPSPVLALFDAQALAQQLRSLPPAGIEEVAAPCLN